MALSEPTEPQGSSGRRISNLPRCVTDHSDTQPRNEEWDGKLSVLYWKKRVWL